eukprot:1146015-Pelagomonas_calceolata.AAC.6
MFGVLSLSKAVECSWEFEGFPIDRQIDRGNQLCIAATSIRKVLMGSVIAVYATERFITMRWMFPLLRFMCLGV